jgi:hypothetical protein
MAHTPSIAFSAKALHFLSSYETRRRSNQPKDWGLTSRLAMITSQWEEVIRSYTNPWQIRLEGQPWRIGEGGEICAKGFPGIGTWSDDRMMADAPLNAMQLPTFIEAARPVETKAMLRLGMDANWPVSITVASLSLTYEIDWNGIQWEDDKQSIARCWKKFTEAATADRLTQPPAFQRWGVPWDITLRKESNAFRILLRETRAGVKVSTPEDPGEPAMILFAPKAIVKFRSIAADARERLIGCVHTLDQGRLSLTEGLITKECAMIGSLGDGVASGEIPRHYRATTRPGVEGAEIAYHYRIHEAGLRTQNHDKGFEKFVRKYERNEAMTATVSVQSGYRDDRGWAVYCTQGPRRCLLLDTVDGLTDEETLWTA